MNNNLKHIFKLLVKNPALFFGGVVMVVLVIGLAIVMTRSQQSTENRSKAAGENNARVYLQSRSDSDSSKAGVQVPMVNTGANVGDPKSPNMIVDVKLDTGGREVIAVDLTISGPEYVFKNIKSVKFTGGRANPELYNQMAILQPDLTVPANQSTNTVRFLVGTKPGTVIKANGTNIGNIQFQFINKLGGNGSVDAMEKMLQLFISKASIVTKTEVINISSPQTQSGGQLNFELVNLPTDTTIAPPTDTPVPPPTYTPAPLNATDDLSIRCENFTLTFSQPEINDNDPNTVTIANGTSVTYRANYSVNSSSGSPLTDWLAGLRYQYNGVGDPTKSVLCGQNSCTFVADATKGQMLYLYSNIHKKFAETEVYCKYDSQWESAQPKQNFIGPNSICVNNCVKSLKISTVNAPPAATATPTNAPALSTPTPTTAVAVKTPTPTPTGFIVVLD